MQNSSPSPPNHPSTPAHSPKRYPSLSIQTYQPMHSSPLAESPKSSPVLSAQRRKSSYKSGFPICPFIVNTSSSASTTEEPQKAFLRERFKARCLERARKDRERARGRVNRSRSSDGSTSGGSSDGDAEMESEGEEVDEDTMMQDELFRRIMENSSRKHKHSYRLSYAHEVGSSVDPDMEDVGKWEAELQEKPQDANVAPQDIEDEELQAYAEEYAALVDFEDLDDVDWSLSDLEDIDIDPHPQKSTAVVPSATAASDGDVDMT